MSTESRSRRQRTKVPSSHENSAVNIFSLPSTASSELGTGVHRDVTVDHNRKIIESIVNKIFDDQTGYYEASSSACSTVVNVSSEYSFDKRLQYWRSTVEERKKIAEEIQEKTGKPSGDVLFQRRTTVDDRDRRTMQRVMDYADRLNPQTLVKRKRLVLADYIEPRTCRYIQELKETLPRAERDKHKIVEISGLPEVSKLEQLGRCYDWLTSIPCPKWCESKLLYRRVEERREDLERVIEYYPDIEHLQIVGENIEGKAVKPDATVVFLDELDIKSISSDTVEDEQECKYEVKVQTEPEPVSYGLRVNDQVFYPEQRRSARNVEVEVRFECEPFEKVVKRIMTVKNIGQEVLSFVFVQREYYFKDMALLKANDDEFLFDARPFRLLANESREILVQFQPRKVDIVKQKWLIKVEPQFFCRRADAIIMKLSGRCKPAPEYANKIRDMKRMVIEKSNTKMMRQLGKNLASMTPLLKPNEVLCPYRRPLSELEVFEQENFGYMCARYTDLELLKDIYRRIKKPREPAWDLKLSTLNELILRLEHPERRALVFNEMISVLEGMKGQPLELAEKIEKSPERERRCFIYVRGIISTGIDEWEQLVFGIEETFVKSALFSLEAPIEVAKKESILEEASEEDNAAVLPPKKTPILPIWPSREELLAMAVTEQQDWLSKKVHRDKAFRDTIYLQTYTIVCNFCEDIVSTIESTSY